MSSSPHRTGDTNRLSWTRRLGAKIAFGFLVVLILHVSVAAVGHIGISGARHDLAQIDRDRRTTDEMVEIDRLVRELQQHVVLYGFTGHGSLEERAAQLQSSLRDRLTHARLTSVDPVDVTAMGGVLDRYEEQFALAKEDRARRKDIVDQALVEATVETSRALDELDLAAWDEQDDRLAGASSTVRREFLHAQSEVWEYVHRLDYPAVRSAIARTQASQALLEKHAAATPEGVRCLERLGEYTRLLNRLVQATRGYLHLMNVVIAGETAEFLRLSERVRRRHVEQLEASYARISASQARFEQLSTWVSIVTILAACLASSTITRTVVKPLRAISSTLVELATGDRDVDIPHRGRADEIGDMARAAEVFRGKNAETAELLADTQRSNRDLEQFAYVASHDLQEPLRMVASYVQMIERRYVSQLDDTAREFIAFAVDGTVRMKALINDLLAYSRVGRGETRQEPVSLGEIVDSATANLRTSITECGAEVSHGELPEVLGDRAQLTQILQNLIGNAVKFRGEAPPAVEIGAREDAHKSTVWVRDNGIGIAHRHLERIFTVFQRLHTCEQYNGTGIGLAVCRRLVERHGGRIWVESEPGEGATFFFTLRRTPSGPLPALPAGPPARVQG